MSVTNYCGQGIGECCEIFRKIIEINGLQNVFILFEGGDKASGRGIAADGD